MIKKYLIPKGKLCITTSIDVEGFETVIKLSELNELLDEFEKEHKSSIYPFLDVDYLKFQKEDWKKLRGELK